MSILKQRTPRQLKILGRRLSVATGRRTSGLRMRPSFVLAGAQRCGTTSLYRALIDHPSVLSPVHHKGVNYFDVNYEAGWEWYLGHFPLRSLASLRARGTGAEPVTFDASGYYSYHPHAARRLGADLPDVKVLLMVRDPVERAYSAYKHELGRRFETEDFLRALQLEDERVEPELARMHSDEGYASFTHRHNSYRRRGQYAEQLSRLREQVGPDRVLVVDSHDFFTQPEVEYARVLGFLGLQPHLPARFDRWNARPGSDMPSDARRFLSEAFAPHNEELGRLLGRPPSWCR